MNKEYTNHIVLTVFEADRPITKVVRLDDDGRLVKTVPPQMTRGRAYRLRLAGTGELVELLESMEPRHALAFGEPRDQSRDAFAVVTKSELPSVTTPGVIARTREHLQWADAPGVLLMDIDAPRGGEPMGIVEALEALCAAVPELSMAPMVIRPSSSSCIWHGERELAGVRGIHVYVIVADARRIPEMGEAIRGRLWLAGFGRYEVARSGALLERTIVDATVWQPERLVFAAGAHCLAPLEQRRGSPIVRNADAPPLEALPALTPDELRRVEALQRAARDAAAPLARERRAAFTQELAERLTAGGGDGSQATQIARRALEHQTLHASFPIVLADGRTVTVGEILDDPARYHGTLCRDPLEPDYDNGRIVGKIYLNGIPTLHSFAHGGTTYKLTRAPRRIEVVSGRTREMTDEILEHLRNANDVFDLGSELVIVRDGRIIPLGKDTLSYYLGGELEFFGTRRMPRGGILEEPKDPPKTAVDWVLALGPERRLKKLDAVISAPLVRLDGTVLMTPGYDTVSHLFYDPGAETPPAVPVVPTADEIDQALEAIMEPFTLFPYAGVLDRSVLLAALLSAVERPVLPTCPGIAIDAPAQGSGKTLLASALAVLATGQPPEVWPHTGERDEETRKRLTTALAAGERVIIWDNVVGMFDSASLASALTAPVYRDRLLKTNTAVSVPNRTLFCVTGNNLVLGGDLPRRFLVCRIDPQIEKPFVRRFPFDPMEMVQRQRQRLAAAACTVIRAWLSSSDYRDGIRAPGSTASFERWDELVRQPVAWLARRDPQRWCDPMSALLAATTADPEIETLGELLAELAKTFGDRPFLARDLMDRLDGPRDDLFGAVSGALGGDPRSVRQIGRLLLHRRDRIARGLVLRRCGDDRHAGAALWRVCKV